VCHVSLPSSYRSRRGHIHLLQALPLVGCRSKTPTGTADRPAWAADCPLKPTEPPEANPEKHRPRGPRGLSARHPRTVRPAHADRPKPRPTKTRKHNRSKTKASKNTKNTRRTAKPRTVRHTLADCPCLADRAENCSTSKVNTSNPSPDLPNGRSC
jgi:hypothetical protein